MNRKQDDQLDIAHDYELTAAWCLANGRTDMAEKVLAWADELHEMVDKDMGAAA